MELNNSCGYLKSYTVALFLILTFDRRNRLLYAWTEHTFIVLKAFGYIVFVFCDTSAVRAWHSGKLRLRCFDFICVELVDVFQVKNQFDFVNLKHLTATFFVFRIPKDRVMIYGFGCPACANLFYGFVRLVFDRGKPLLLLG